MNLHIQITNLSASDLPYDDDFVQRTASALQLEADSKCPDVLDLEWDLRADNLALVPWPFGTHAGHASGS